MRIIPNPAGEIIERTANWSVLLWPNRSIYLPEALSSVLSFSEQQVHDLINIVHSVMQQYFAPQNQPPSNQTISASIPSVETSSSSQDPASITAERPHKALRAEQVGIFDPEYQLDQ